MIMVKGIVTIHENIQHKLLKILSTISRFHSFGLTKSTLIQSRLERIHFEWTSSTRRGFWGAKNLTFFPTRVKNWTTRYSVCKRIIIIILLLLGTPSVYTFTRNEKKYKITRKIIGFHVILWTSFEIFLGRDYWLLSPSMYGFGVHSSLSLIYSQINDDQFLRPKWWKLSSKPLAAFNELSFDNHCYLNNF